MNLQTKELIALVKDMRKKQEEYFLAKKTKHETFTYKLLDEAKKAEKALGKFIKQLEVADAQPSLFELEKEYVELETPNDGTQRLAVCSACTSIANGCKFRVAPKHTCGL